MSLIRISKNDLVNQPYDVLLRTELIESVFGRPGNPQAVKIFLLSGDSFALETNDPDKIINMIEAGG